MNKSILFVFMLVAMAIQTNAQNSIVLNINHKLGDADFALNQASKNNIDHDFAVTRFEYYISEISLVHDGGLETEIENVWILVNAENATQVNLGEFNINTVEQIRFHIGVDPDHNHLDPASWPADHALAPVWPSMHWGWTAGYRFVAIEGKGGPNLDQLFQLHGLGDSNYFSQKAFINATEENNVISLNLDADYARALDNIELNSGVIVHGENLEARQCLENFINVFSASNITSSTNDYNNVNEFSVFPNPIKNGMSTIKLDLIESGNNYDVSITTSEGRQMKYHTAIINGQRVDFTDYANGIYFVNLIKEGQVIKTQKVIVQ